MSLFPDASVFAKGSEVWVQLEKDKWVACIVASIQSDREAIVTKNGDDASHSVALDRCSYIPAWQ